MSLIVNQAKTIDSTLPATMTEDTLSHGKEEYIYFSAKSGNTKHLSYILRNYFILALIYFCINIFSKNKGLRFKKIIFCNFCNFSLFLQNPKQSYSFLSENYTTESIKLQQNLGNINRNSRYLN